MSRYLIVTWDGAGNLVSTLGIARELVERGHDVRLLGHRSIDERCGSHGWRFLPLAEAEDFDSTVAGDVASEFETMINKLWFNPALGNEVLEELGREPADVVIVDCMLFGALTGAQASGVPTVALFHAPFSGYRGGPMVDMLAPGIAMVNELRAQLGRSPVTSMADVHDACALGIVATPREYDVDMPTPDNVRFVGPILDGPPLTTQLDTLDIDDGPEPLVVVSFSTSFQDQLQPLQRVVDALGELPVRVVVTTGSAIPARAITAPANTTVVGYAPHVTLLPHASAVVTHAGLGTVMASLRHGVPLVCMPMGRDQFFNAAMVERLGAGPTIPMDADGDTIRAAVQSVLNGSAARDGAKRMAGVIAGYGGAADAVNELEALA